MGQAAIPFVVATAVSAGISIYMASQFDNSVNDIGTSVNKSGTSAARNPVYGTCVANGIPVYNNVQNRNRANLLNVFACGIGVTGIRQLYIDDVEVLGSDLVSRRETPDGGTNQLRYGSSSLINGFEKQCEIQLRAGLDTGVPMQLAIDYGDGEWTDAMRGDRVCAVAIRSRRIVDEEAVRIMADQFKVSMLVDGLPLYDPRYNQIGEKQFYHTAPDIPENHRECGRNPALAILDYLTNDYYGMGKPLEFFDIESFKAAATWCDENDFHIDGQLDNTQEFSKNIDDMLKCANLSLTNGGDFIQLRYEDVEMPVQDFDEHNIINGTLEITEQNSSDYANVIEVEFKNTELDEEKDVFTLPEDVNSDPQIIEDGFVESVTLSMPLVRYAGSKRNDTYSPMKKIANRELARRKYQKQIRFDVDLYETPVRIFDIVTVTDEELGWEQKEFRVTAIERSLSSDRFNIATISLTEYADEIYLGTRNGGGGSAKLVKTEVSAPTNLNFSIEDYTSRGYGTLTWNRTWFEADAEFLVDYKRSSESAWTRLGRTKDRLWKVARLFPDSYDFRVATHSNLYGTSDFVQIDNYIVSSLGTLPNVTGAVGEFDGLVCEFKWDDMLDRQVEGDFEDIKLVREVFSHYRVSLFDVSNGESLIDTFTTANNTFTWTYEQNVSASLTRSLRVKVEIVAIDGSMSNITSSATATAINAQCDVPTGLNNYGRLGAIWFNYDPSADSDWSGTEIHVSETAGFVPSSQTLAGVLGKQTSWTWYYPEGTPDNEIRYIKIGHFDSFGRDNIKFSPEQAIQNYHIDNDATPFDDTDLQNQIAANDAVLAAHEAELGQHDARMDGHDSTLASHNLRMNDHDTTLAAHETTMNNLQSDLDAAEQAFSEQIPNVSNELSQLRNAANAPTLPSGTPIDTRINIVASPDKTETAAWGLFASNNGKSQFIVAADEFIVAGGNNGNAANDDVAFYFSNGQLLINNATIKNLTASNIAANAINSSHIAAGSIVASDIATGTITSTQLAANSVTASEIAADAVTASKIAANAITSSHIAAGSIVASDIATGTITSTQLAANSVTASEIATNAVTANKIAAGAITAAKISSNAIETNHLSTGAITAAKISSGAITASKISADAINGSHVSASSDIVVGSGYDIVRLNGSDSTWRIAAGNASMSSSPFRVDKDGKMYATNAVVSGSVTATGGRISGSLYVGTGNNSSDYTVWYGNKHPNTNGESFRMVSDGKYRLRQWYNGRTIWYQNDGSSYFLDVNPAANTAKFYGTVQAEKIVGDIVSATAKGMNYRSSNASVSRYSWLNVTQVTISNSRPYDRTVIIEPMNIDSIFVTIYSNSGGQYDAIYRLVDENGTVFFESRIDNKFFTGSTPPYKASPSVRRVFASIPAHTPAGVLYLQFRCTSRDTLSTHIDYDGDRRLNHKLTAQLFQNSNEIH